MVRAQDELHSSSSASLERRTRIAEKLVDEAVRDHGEALRRIVRQPGPDWLPLLSEELIRHIRRIHDAMDEDETPRPSGFGD